MDQCQARLAGTMRALIIDAFTRTAGAGNRAGLVPDAAGLDEQAMQRVATAIGVSETAFLLRRDEVSVQLRYFTPASEIPFCGHATVATFHFLAESGALPFPGKYRLDCPAGSFEVELERERSGDCRVWLSTPQFPFVESPLAKAMLLELLGGEAESLDSALPIVRAGPRIYLPFATRAAVWALSPHWDALAAAGTPHGVHGFYAFTRETVGSGSVTHGRYFAPAMGVREDPVTGSASGPLAAYLREHGLLRGRANAEQGHAMGKPGFVTLEASETSDAVRIGGVAISVLDGRLTCTTA
jgi:trans-2,3-dihydro-3-hydroxyanthranilate isomerase